MKSSNFSSVNNVTSFSWFYGISTGICIYHVSLIKTCRILQNRKKKSFERLADIQENLIEGMYVLFLSKV